MAEENEAELIAGLQRGEEVAFGLLVQRYQGQVFRLVFRLLGDYAEAEDVAQEVFVAVFKAVERFRGDSRLSTWLYRIATNHAKNRLEYLARRGRNERRVYDERIDPQSISTNTTARIDQPDRLVEGYQAEHLITTALASLDPDQRLLIVLRDLEQLSYEEVQRITGLPIGTVKSRLHRARAALFQSFRQLQEEQAP